MYKTRVPEECEERERERQGKTDSLLGQRKEEEEETFKDLDEIRKKKKKDRQTKMVAERKKRKRVVLEFEGNNSFLYNIYCCCYLLSLGFLWGPLDEWDQLTTCSDFCSFVV